MAARPLPSDVDVVVVGAGAAGIAAGRRLSTAGVRFVVLEARERIGGRAHTVTDAAPFPIDLGCGWLHSADRNPFVPLAEDLGLRIDRHRPTWGSQAGDRGFPAAAQARFQATMAAFFAGIEAYDEDGPDRTGTTLVPPDAPFAALVDAVSTYVNGVELDRLSVRDVSRYADTQVNWRVPDGYGTLIARLAAGLPIATGCPVTAIDHGRRRIRVETAAGAVDAAAVIVTVPTSLLSAETIAFVPALPEKTAAAAGVPLGLADKVHLTIDRPEDLEPGHLFGRIDRAATGSYHVRPLGKPAIEGYFGGRFAAELEAAGPEAMAALAIEELAGLYGHAIRDRLTPVAATAWGRDPWSRGSYSAALPGHADERAVLAAPVDDRLFFAGEATSRHDFSTAHGAWRTGLAAADAALAALNSSGASG